MDGAILGHSPKFPKPQFHSCVCAHHSSLEAHPIVFGLVSSRPSQGQPETSERTCQGPLTRTGAVEGSTLPPLEIVSPPPSPGVRAGTAAADTSLPPTEPHAGPSGFRASRPGSGPCTVTPQPLGLEGVGKPGLTLAGASVVWWGQVSRAPDTRPGLGAPCWKSSAAAWLEARRGFGKYPMPRPLSGASSQRLWGGAEPWSPCTALR